MNTFVLGFREIDRSKSMVVGGKGANLGELSRIQGIQVPDGFCVATEAYKKITGNHPQLDGLLDELSRLKAEDRAKIGELSGEIRRVIEGIAIPEEIHRAIDRLLCSLGEKDAYAIRSSATAEDLPTASFAGQQDTYLNIIGKTRFFLGRSDFTVSRRLKTKNSPGSMVEISPTTSHQGGTNGSFAS